MLFKRINQEIKMLEESNAEAEKEIQKLVENNLKDVFPSLNLTFVQSELVIGNFRFDSLAFDEENKVFYIIEYKNVEKKSLIDQGVAYLKTLLDRKHQFVYLINEFKKTNYKLEDIDWSSTRVIYIAPSYNNYQLEIAKLNNAPFSLYKFAMYGKDFFSIDKIDYKSQEKIDFNDLNIKIIPTEVREEIKVYSENDHLKDKSVDIKDLYESIKNKIEELGQNITIEPKKFYIAFKGTKRNIVDLEIFKSQIVVQINLRGGELEDPFNISKMMLDEKGNKIGHHGNGDYQVRINNKEDIDKLMYLVKQSYKKNS